MSKVTIWCKECSRSVEFTAVLRKNILNSKPWGDISCEDGHVIVTFRADEPGTYEMVRVSDEKPGTVYPYIPRAKGFKRGSNSQFFKDNV